MLASATMVRLDHRVEHRERVLLWALATYGAVTVTFGVSRRFWLTFGCLAVVGAADAVSTALRGIIRQIETPDRLRGRVNGVTMAFFLGGPQLGELEAGLVAHWWSAPASVITGGLAGVAATVWMATREPSFRRYPRVGGVSHLRDAAGMTSADKAL
jgi:predicted MFS family arabinose efflux permease